MKKLKEYQKIQSKIIIFDFDGVLADTIKIKGEVFYNIFKKYGKETQLFAKKIHYENIGLPRKKKFNEILKFAKENDINHKIKIIDKEFVKNYLKFQKKIKVNKHFAKFIKNNKSEFLFYVASAAPKKEILNILKINNLNKYFKKIFDTNTKKEKAINEIINRNKQCNKNDCIFIGDSPHDLKAAENQNIHFFAYKFVPKYNNITIINHSNLFNKKIYEYFSIN